VVDNTWSADCRFENAFGVKHAFEGQESQPAKLMMPGLPSSLKSYTRHGGSFYVVESVGKLAVP
jgi:hypothetical protein